MDRWNKLEEFMSRKVISMFDDKFCGGRDLNPRPRPPIMIGCDEGNLGCKVVGDRCTRRADESEGLSVGECRSGGSSAQEADHRLGIYTDGIYKMQGTEPGKRIIGRAV